MGILFDFAQFLAAEFVFLALHLHSPALFLLPLLLLMALLLFIMLS